MTRMAISIRKGPVNRQCVRPHLRELMMQANPIALNMKVQTTARGVGSSPKAPSMANPGKPHSIRRVRQYPDQSTPPLTAPKSPGRTILARLGDPASRPPPDQPDKIG